MIAPLARAAVVRASGGEHGLVEAVDGIAVAGLKREVEPGRGLAGSDEELVGREEATAP